MKVFFLSLILFFVSVVPSAAQTNILLKVYHNSDFVKRTEVGTYPDYQESKDIKSLFSRISIGIAAYTNEGLNHEIEFSYARSTPPIIHTSRDASYTNSDKDSDYYSVQYELSKNLSLEKNTFLFSLGTSIYGYWSKIFLRPLISNAFAIHDRYVGATLNIVPRLSYQIAPKFLIELNTRFGLIDIREHEFRIFNPSIPINQQSQKDVELNLFPAAYNVRLGISYRIK